MEAQLLEKAINDCADRELTSAEILELAARALLTTIELIEFLDILVATIHILSPGVQTCKRAIFGSKQPFENIRRVAGVGRYG